MNAAQTTALFKQLLIDQGFERVGVAAAERLPHGDYLRRWLEGGRAGEMDYLHRNGAQRCDPSRMLPGARSVVVAAISYHQPAPPPSTQPAEGRVAMYAWGRDYHRVIKDKLWAVIDTLREQVDDPFDARPCVDTAPVLERELAMASGIGWIGKNTLVLNEDMGSYFFLGEIVTTLELETDAPATDHCGSCTRCLEACPTAAFPQPYEMDARRRISYHTIELRGDIPEEFHAGIGDWIFGCDVCQQVCPFNRDAPFATEPQFAPGDSATSLPADQVLSWSEVEYRHALRGSAMKRAKLDMLQRNARIVHKNLADRAEKSE